MAGNLEVVHSGKLWAFEKKKKIKLKSTSSRQLKIIKESQLYKLDFS